MLSHVYEPVFDSILDWLRWIRSETGLLALSRAKPRPHPSVVTPKSYEGAFRPMYGGDGFPSGFR